MSYINKQYWEQFYKNNVGLNEASTFSEFILNKVSASVAENIIIDLGCGTGKDTFNFAKNGFEVVGIDGSEEVIKINNSKTSDEHLSSKKIGFYCVDLSNANQVALLMSELNTRATLSGKKIIFYNRFFLHAIPEEVESLILQSILTNITAPFSIMAEFRTKEDEDLDKVYNDHYRRYVDTDYLLDKMLKLKFSVKGFSKGRGYSIYKNEDPYLARLIVEKN